MTRFLRDGFPMMFREGEGAAAGAAAGTAAATGAEGAAAAAAAGAAAGTGVGTGAADWTAGFDPDVRAAIGTKGFKTANDLGKSYFELEKTVGLDKLPLPPKDKDGKRDWSKWDGYKELGRPESFDKYDVTGVKPPAGVTMDAEAIKAALPKLHAAGFTQDQVAAALQMHADHMGGLVAQQTQATEQRAADAHAALQTEWGPAYDTKVALAIRGIQEFGGADLVKSLTNAGLLDKDGGVLDPVIAKSFAAVGAKLAGETGGLERGRGDGNSSAIMTPAEASSAHKAMMAETFAARAKGESHPGHDRRHPEYAAYQEKAGRLLKMMSTADGADTKASARE